MSLTGQEASSTQLAGLYDFVLETTLLDVICTNEDELVAALVGISKLLNVPSRPVGILHI